MSIAFLTGISWGVGLLGVSVIVMGGEAARRYFGLHVGWFWLTMGSIFVVRGACELLKIKVSDALLPIMCIVIGAAILATALRPKGKR